MNLNFNYDRKYKAIKTLHNTPQKKHMRQKHICSFVVKHWTIGNLISNWLTINF